MRVNVVVARVAVGLQERKGMRIVSALDQCQDHGQDHDHDRCQDHGQDIHSKSGKVCGVCFSVTKNLRKNCVNLDIKILRQKCVNQ